jgi:hypothetical protein
MTERTPITVDALLALEAGVLGAAILDVTGRQAKILTDYVSECDWVSPLYRAIFAAIRSLLQRDCVPLEYLSVCTELQAMGTFQSYNNAYSLVSSIGEGVVLARPMTKRIADLRRLWKQRKEALAG